MNDGGILMRTAMRLALRAPVMVGLCLLLSFAIQWLSAEYTPLVTTRDWGWTSEAITWSQRGLAIVLLLLATMVLTISGSRRMEGYHQPRLSQIAKGSAFGAGVMLFCGALSAGLIAAAYWATPEDGLLRDYRSVYLFAALLMALVMLSPGLFTLVFAMRLGQGVVLVKRLWREHRGGLIRSAFIVALVTSCVGVISYAITGIVWTWTERLADYFFIDLSWFGSDRDNRRTATALSFAYAGFITAHVTVFERILEWERGPDVTGVFD